MPYPVAPPSGPASPDRARADVDSPWHTLGVSAVQERLGVSSEGGLSPEEASRRAMVFGPNTLREKPGRSIGHMVADQFGDVMIVVLIAAAVVSGIIGDIKDTLAIVAIVLLNAVIGFVQAYRAERAIAALKRMAAGNARVVRGGETLTVPIAEVVIGDLALIEAGNLVPADLRLIEAVELRMDEALLTGESATIEKGCAPLQLADLPLGDRRNMAYKGAVATSGRGRGIVVATGMATELGKIATLLEGGTEPKTPLQRRLAVFGRRLGYAILGICALVFIAGLLRGGEPLLLLLTAISLAVAAIPEALPAVVTISLALGASKLARQHALIRHLPAVETLGSVTSICSDKTGTLTVNRMRVVEIYCDGNVIRDWRAQSGTDAFRALMMALALANDAGRSRHGRVSGDPTEVALYHAAFAAGLDKAVLEAATPRVHELPFDSERKRMTTVHRWGHGALAFTKGAPEAVLARCTSRAGGGAFSREAVLAVAERMAAEGLRVLAFAQRKWPRLPTRLDPANVESGLEFSGLVGLIDPPRREAKDAVSTCRSAGITPIVITGDHPATARAIARELGIVGDGGRVVSGVELARMSDAELARHAADVRVYARVDPAQKIRIVEALQRRGEIVAMTGDGVNDAPALSRADIGVAMGKNGTDVAREASSLVLLDDNFATIVGAVREGRRIFDNIRKFIRFALTGNSGEIWTIFLAPFLGLPIPLLPIQILWVNLVTDGLPGLALAAEPEERGVMRRPPRPLSESVFANGLWQHVLWVGLLIGALTLGAQAIAIYTGSTHWRTMAFTVLTLTQLMHVLAIRSERESLFQQGLLTNVPLLGAVAITLALSLATIYVPLLNDVFDTDPLSAGELGLCVGLSSLVFVAVEIEKWCVRRGWLYATPPQRRPRPVRAARD